MPEDFKDLFILQRGGDFIIFRWLTVDCPDDNWLIEAEYVDEAASYEEAAQIIRDALG